MLTAAMALTAAALASLSALEPVKPAPPVPPAAPIPEAWQAEMPAAASASNAFGLDVYRALAAGSKDANLFVSPYSLSVALAMAAEGARDETYDQMASVLHLPDAAGDQRGIARVHGGYAALSEHFRTAAGVADEATRAKIKSLRAELEKTNKEVDRLTESKEWQKGQAAANRARVIAAELNGILKTVDRFDLRVANALWVEKTFPIVPSFVETIARYYGTGGTGGMTPVDFKHDAERVRTRINAWVEEHTENRIKDLIPRGGVDDLTRLVITNAVYFRGEWTNPFEESRTKDVDFTSALGAKSKVPMMNDPWRGNAGYAAFNADGSVFATPREVPADAAEAAKVQTYPDAGGFTMLELPYKGDTMSMLLILPRDPAGLSAVESQLTGANLEQWTKSLDRRSVDTAMPRFKMEWSGEMSGVLRGLGMERAFVVPGRKGAAQFPGISDSTDPQQQVYIGAVIHKSWVEVNEKGTEAAAATAIVMPTAAKMQAPKMIPFTPRFHAEHAFIFLIRDMKTGVVVFVGRKAA